MYFFESHQKYIYYQLIVEGEEQMEMTHSYSSFNNKLI